MSAGESLSRAAMFRLNLPRPDLQVPVEDAQGLIGMADFGWPGVVGEFDGRRKSGVAPGSDPTEAAEVLWREKRREDRFRRQVRVARWVWADARDDRTLAGILAEQGVRAQARNTWIDLAPPPRERGSVSPGSGPAVGVASARPNGGAVAPPVALTAAIRRGGPERSARVRPRPVADGGPARAR